MRMNQIKLGSVLSYLSLILGTIVSMIYTPIMTSRLGQSEYGVYSLVLPMVSYLNLFSFGLGSAYTRFYTRYKVDDDRQGMAKLNGMFIIIYSILGILVLAVGFIIAANPLVAFGSKLTPDELSLASRLMYIMTITAAVTFPISVFESNAMVNERYVFLKIIALIKSVLNPLIIIPLLLIGYRSEAIAYLSLIFAVVSGFFNIRYCFKKLKIKFRFGNFDFGLLKEMFKFTSYVFIGIVVDQLNWTIDKLLLGRFVGSGSVSIYNIASQLNIYYMSMATTFSGILTPRVHQMVTTNRSNKEISDLFIKVGRFQFIILTMILFGFIAVGYPFVLKWGGPEYGASYAIAIILFIPTILPCIQNLGIEIQRAKNMHKFRSIVYLLVAIVNIFLSIPLCIYFKEIGVAVGTAIPVLVGNGLLMNWYYDKYIGLDIKRFWRRIIALLPSLVLPCIASILIALFVNIEGYLGILIYGCIYLVIFITSVWVLGLTRYEKEIVLSPLRKLLRRL